MSLKKRAPASVSSGQPIQPKRQCRGSVNQATGELEDIQTPMTLEDVRRVFREELERAVFREELERAVERIERFREEQERAVERIEMFRKDQESVVERIERFREELDRAVGRFEGSTGQSLNKNWKHSLEEVMVKEAPEHAHDHSAYCRRAHDKSREMNDVKNLRLHFRTKLSLPVYTGRKLEGEKNDAIHVALIDANTEKVVSSGPESSTRLEVCVLNGDFDKDDNEDWTPKEFQTMVVGGRERKGQLLLGNCQVVLNKGVGVLGDLKFNDNSSWIPSQKFRIGLKVVSGYCENARIREAITEAFRVKEHRGELSEKKYPPERDDELWRLEKIARDGKFHERLTRAKIHNVGDFLDALSGDPENLKSTLEMGEKSWKILVDHAKTCNPSGKLDAYSQDDTTNKVVENGAYFASHRLYTSKKENADSTVEKARDNRNRVEEFHGDSSIASIQDKHSNFFPSRVTECQIKNLNHDHVEHSFPPQVCPSAVDGEASLLMVESTSEGHDGINAGSLPIQSQNISSQDSIQQSQNISLQTRLPLAGQPYALRSGFSDIGHNGITAVALSTQSQNISPQGSLQPSQSISLQTNHRLVGQPCSSRSGFNDIGHDGIPAVASGIQSQNIRPQGSLQQSQNISLPTNTQLTDQPSWLPSSSDDIGHDGINAGSLPMQSQNISSQDLIQQSQNNSLQTRLPLAGQPCSSRSGFSDIGHNGIIAEALSTQSQNISPQGSLQQSQSISFQTDLQHSGQPCSSRSGLNDIGGNSHSEIDSLISDLILDSPSRNDYSVNTMLDSGFSWGRIHVSTCECVPIPGSPILSNAFNEDPGDNGPIPPGSSIPPADDFWSG